jgi:AraC-like DNA-binding protein
MATISVHHVTGALKGMQRRGFDPETALVAAGINPRILQRKGARVYDRQMARLIQRIWDLLGDEFMGFTERPCKPGAFSYMAKSVRRSETLREALQSGIRFYRLMTDDIDTRLTESDGLATIEISFRRPDLDPDSFYQEFWMVIWHRLASWYSGVRIPLQRAMLAQAQPEHQLELKYLFPCGHTFGCPSNKLQFDTQYLALPLVRTEGELNDFLRHSPFDLLTIPGYDRSLAAELKRRLASNGTVPLQFPSLDELASQLGMQPQTLYRRLQKEGLGYQAIKDELRRDLAISGLVKDRLPVHRVAELAGYREPRSFTRAFRKWTGLSPREYCRFL